MEATKYLRFLLDRVGGEVFKMYGVYNVRVEYLALFSTSSTWLITVNRNISSLLSLLTLLKRSIVRLSMESSFAVVGSSSDVKGLFGSYLLVRVSVSWILVDYTLSFFAAMVSSFPNSWRHNFLHTRMWLGRGSYGESAPPRSEVNQTTTRFILLRKCQVR